MAELIVKSGDLLTVDGDVVIRLDRTCAGCAHLTIDPLDDIELSRCSAGAEDVQDYLSETAKEIISRFSEMDAAASQEALGKFVSDLFYAVAQKRQQEERQHKQAEGIVKAKAKGVRFGPTAKPLPDNFDEIYQAWRRKELTLRQAAEACGMAKSSFYEKAVQRERKAEESA